MLSESLLILLFILKHTGTVYGELQYRYRYYTGTHSIHFHPYCQHLPVQYHQQFAIKNQTNQLLETFTRRGGRETLRTFDAPGLF